MLLPNRTTLFALTLTAVCLAPPAGAQAVAPAAELEPLGALVGHWVGKGSVVRAPGDEALAWTARASYRWVLDGHGLREDSEIVLPGYGEDAGEVRLVFRNVIGWDRALGRLRVLSATGFATVGVSDAHFVDGALVNVVSSVEDGQPLLERWTTQVDGDKFTMRGEELRGTNAFHVHAEGVFERTAQELADLDVGTSVVPAPPEMSRLRSLAGSYRVQGQVVPIAGMQPMPVKGLETLTPIFGGAVIETAMQGEPFPGARPYLGWGLIGWDAARGCYLNLWIDNMGELTVGESRWAGTRLVTTASGMRYGAPYVESAVMSFGKDGRPTALAIDSITSGAAAERRFEVRYTPQE